MKHPNAFKEISVTPVPTTSPVKPIRADDWARAGVKIQPLYEVGEFKVSLVDHNGRDNVQFSFTGSNLKYLTRVACNPDDGEFIVDTANDIRYINLLKHAMSIAYASMSRDDFPTIGGMTDEHIASFYRAFCFQKEGLEELAVDRVLNLCMESFGSLEAIHEVLKYLSRKHTAELNENNVAPPHHSYFIFQTDSIIIPFMLGEFTIRGVLFNELIEKTRAICGYSLARYKEDIKGFHARRDAILSSADALNAMLTNQSPTRDEIKHCILQLKIYLTNHC